MFGYWNEFCEFRSNLADEKVMPTIERRRKHAKIKERQRQLELEEKQARVRVLWLIEVFEWLVKNRKGEQLIIRKLSS